jgi:hypothetical protein
MSLNTNMPVSTIFLPTEVACINMVFALAYKACNNLDSTEDRDAFIKAYLYARLLIRKVADTIGCVRFGSDGHSSLDDHKDANYYVVNSHECISGAIDTIEDAQYVADHFHREVFKAAMKAVGRVLRA